MPINGRVCTTRAFTGVSLPLGHVGCYMSHLEALRLVRDRKLGVALVLGARGGVYIGGGIVPRLGERFFGSRFRERFEGKGRFQAYLRAIPTALITDTLAALTGSALALEQHRG